MTKHAISEAKLRKLLELNGKLKEQLEISRIPVSEASRSYVYHLLLIHTECTNIVDTLMVG